MTYRNRHILSKAEFDRQSDELDKVKYTCNCGHRVIIPYYKDKTLCNWCHNYVYKDKKIEFKERLKVKLK